MSTKEISLAEAVAYLGAIKEGKSSPTIAGKVARSRTMYKAGSSVELSANNGDAILPDTDKAPGVTNFEKGNTVPAGSSFLVYAVRNLFDVVADATVKNAEWKSSTPANFKNGEMTVSQDGQGMMLNSSGTDLSNDSTSNLGNNSDFRPVVPFMLRAGASFNINFRLATPGVANQLYKTEFRVIEFIESDKA